MLIDSFKIINPKKTACIGSVFEYAVPTAKFFVLNIFNNKKVAIICEIPPNEQNKKNLEEYKILETPNLLFKKIK